MPIESKSWVSKLAIFFYAHFYFLSLLPCLIIYMLNITLHFIVLAVHVLLYIALNFRAIYVLNIAYRFGLVLTTDVLCIAFYFGLALVSKILHIALCIGLVGTALISRPSLAMVNVLLLAFMDLIFMSRTVG